MARVNRYDRKGQLPKVGRWDGWWKMMDKCVAGTLPSHGERSERKEHHPRGDRRQDRQPVLPPPTSPRGLSKADEPGRASPSTVASPASGVPGRGRPQKEQLWLVDFEATVYGKLKLFIEGQLANLGESNPPGHLSVTPSISRGTHCPSPNECSGGGHGATTSNLLLHYARSLCPK